MATAKTADVRGIGVRLNVAVIGAGISGLSTAWLLAKQHDVTLYESELRPGGHSHTVDVATPEGRCAVDTGFIVYNTRTYPNLIALFEHLGVPTAPSSMTFAVSLDQGSLEYSGNDLLGLIGNARNVVSPQHWRMIATIFDFFRVARAEADSLPPDLSFGDWLTAKGYGTAFVDRHILPMAAAIWSAPADRMMEFPAAAFLRFFTNHGLLQVFDRPQWRTVKGGSRTYVNRILADLPNKPRLARAVTAVRRSAKSVRVEDQSGASADYDHVVLACHADQSLALLQDPHSDERALLGAFSYAANDAVLHSDPSLMPQRRRLWSSWNYLGTGTGRHRELAVSYWMNKLQPLETATDLFVTLNPNRPIAAGKEHGRYLYQHPIFDRAAMRAQADLWQLQGQRRTWFCGSYFGYGFHEDGIQSGLAVAEELGGVRRPWSVANESGRILAKRDGRLAHNASSALEAAE
jgi:uncharacterized protein